MWALSHIFLIKIFVKKERKAEKPTFLWSKFLTFLNVFGLNITLACSHFSWSKYINNAFSPQEGISAILLYSKNIYLSNFWGLFYWEFVSNNISCMFYPFKICSIFIISHNLFVLLHCSFASFPPGIHLTYWWKYFLNVSGV